ncbi:hypothetical protein PC128_g22364 [Phytophthora cactorum]|nr:hypothetical protein PC128_g22364 [Phytophthora cactorum]
MIVSLGYLRTVGTDKMKRGGGVVVPASEVDMCGLDVEPFWAEQPEVAWIRALIAFLEEGALPVGPLLRAQVVKVAPRHSVENGLLMRLVHLPARVGPARSLPFLWCLCRTYRPFYTTVIRTCCRIWD